MEVKLNKKEWRNECKWFQAAVLPQQNRKISSAHIFNLESSIRILQYAAQQGN